MLAVILACIGLPVTSIHGAAGASSLVHGAHAHAKSHGLTGPWAAIAHPQEPQHTDRPTIRLAITVDDLPGGGPELLGYTPVKIVKEIVATLRAHHVLHAVGFVVGSMLDARPERREAMDAWVQAGFAVGNHTYSHAKVEELGLDGYIKDILADRAVVDPLEQRTGQHHKYFRFPYLEEGRTEAERRALRHVLAAQHYELARVSVIFNDTDWADAYLRCLARADDAALDALRQSYLETALAQLSWSVAAAREVLGHRIPQVLLVHANVATAKNLDALLTAYEHAGVRYVSLDEALTEPAYGARYDFSGENILQQASQGTGRPHPPELVESAELLDLVCR